MIYLFLMVYDNDVFVFFHACESQENIIHNSMPHAFCFCIFGCTYKLDMLMLDILACTIISLSVFSVMASFLIFVIDLRGCRNDLLIVILAG